MDNEQIEIEIEVEVEIEIELEEEHQCGVCGDYHLEGDNIPLSCQTGDGI